MWLKLLLVTLALVLQLRTISSQRQWIPPTTTPAELWNPYTWYWPYAIAASEGYAEYFRNAQQITNQLYTQAYITNAFGWSRPNGSNGTGGRGAVGQAAGQAGRPWLQAGGQAGQAGQPSVQAGGQGGQPWVEAGQGGQPSVQAGGQWK